MDTAVIDSTSRARRKRVVRHYTRKLTLRKFYLDLDKLGRHRFLERAKTTEGYISQIYGGWCLCSPQVARRLDDAPDGKIPAWYLRPDIFDRPADAPSLR